MVVRASSRGYLHGSDVSLILVEALPGRGPRLHKHPYEEIFVVQEGRATFTVGEDTVVATGGRILVAPAGCRTSSSTRETGCSGK